MKILIAISYYHPNISGLTIYAKNLSEELAKRGHEVQIITSRHRKDLVSSEKLGGATVNRLWTPFLFGRGPIMPLYPLNALKACLWADIVNIHTPQFEGFVLAMLAKLFGKKVVMTHHCDLSNWPGLINQITERATYISLLIQGGLSDKIVTYTEDYSKSSDYLRKFKNKLLYILPPVKLVKSSKKYEFEKKFGKVNYKIGFAGRIAKEKGIEYLFNAIPLIKKKLGSGFKIYIAGPGREVVGGGYADKLKNLVNKYGNHVVFLGPLNQQQMSRFYKLIDVLVLPSTEKIESFGFVQVEAMLSGCPVVASNMFGVRSPVVLSRMGELAKVKNSKDLANKIVKVLRNKRKYQRTKRQIKDVFNFDNTIDYYEQTFKQVE